jgi:hypothetical protein
VLKDTNGIDATIVRTTTYRKPKQPYFDNYKININESSLFPEIEKAALYAATYASFG